MKKETYKLTSASTQCLQHYSNKLVKKGQFYCASVHANECFKLTSNFEWQLKNCMHLLCKDRNPRTRN